VPPQSIAARLRDLESKLSAVEARLRQPRREAPDLAKLRDALTKRSEAWAMDLWRETDVARTVVRRLIGPLTLFDPSVPSPEWTEWETSVTADILDGLCEYSLLASPRAVAPFPHVVGRVVPKAA